MAVNPIGKMLKPLFDANALIKDYVSQYVLMPDSTQVFFRDKDIIGKRTLGLELDKPYEPLECAGYGGIIVDPTLLHEASKLKKGDLRSVELEGSMIVVKTDTDSIPFAKLKTDAEPYPAGDKFLDIDEYPARNKMIRLTDEEHEHLVDRRSVILGEGRMFVKVANSMFPKAKTNEIAYYVEEINDDLFYLYTTSYRSPLLVTCRYKCFKPI